MKTKTALRIASLCLAAFTVTGCLLTLGAPLTRRIEPGAVLVEAGAGAAGMGSSSSSAIGPVGYLYAGWPLGKKFELGILPYAYSLGGSPLGAVTLPLRWDPFPYEWPVHLIVFAGPTVFLMDSVSPAATAGLGLSWKPAEWLDLHASASLPIPWWQFFTAAAGARFSLGGNFQLGASGMLMYPGVLVGTVSASFLLAP